MLTSEMRDAISKTVDLPPIPAVALRIIQIANDPDTSASELTRTIQSDQNLTGTILRISNSAFFGRGKKIETLSMAVVFLGFNAIKNLAIAASTKSIRRKFDLTEKLLWEHSIGVALACNQLARIAKFSKPEEGFICGLLHDIGKIVLHNSKPEEYREVMKRFYNKRTPFQDSELEIFGFTHVDISLYLIEQWQLPYTLATAINFHHDLDGAPDDPFLKPLTALVALADAACYRLGIGTREPDESIELISHPANELLKIKEPGFAGFFEDFPEMFENEKSLFE